MLNTLKKNQNIFRFDDDDSQTQNVRGQLDQSKQIIELQKQSIQLNNSQLTSKKIENQTQFYKENTFLKMQSQERQKNPILRRNKSFKVKKQNQEFNKSKLLFSKSISKFANIFEEAQQMDMKSQSKFAVHEQQNNKKLNNPQQAVKIHKFKFNQSAVKNNQPQSILKLSNFTRNQSYNSQTTKKDVRFIDQNDYKNNIMRQTTYTQKPMRELIQKKLTSKTQPRPQSGNASNRQAKARIKTDQIIDMISFIHKKIHKSSILIAKITKNTDGFNFIWPQFRMFDEKSNTHILSAKKKAANTTSNYYVSRNQKQIDVQNNDYMGKIRSNFLGSCFNIFNQGSNPQNLIKQDKNIRKLLCSVIYQSQIANANPKTMRVFMIKPPYSYYDLEGTSLKEQQTNLEDLYDLGSNKQKMHVFKNRKPTYNKKQNKFVLNFQGRIKRPSTKNFILEDSETKREVLMFGKVGDQQYSIYISSPLTPHIALGIALAELDNKLICD